MSRPEAPREMQPAVSGKGGLLLLSLVAGDYDMVDRLTEGRDFSAAELRREVEAVVALLGEPIVDPPVREWSNLIVRPCPAGKRAYDTVVPFWTASGRTGHGMYLHVSENVMQTLDAQIRGFGLIDPADIPSDDEPAPAPAPERETPPSENPVPERWRPALKAVVDRLVAGDYAGIARDGLLAYTNDAIDTSIGYWIEDYPDTLVDLPDHAWAWSDHGPDPVQPDRWWVTVDLWTARRGHSDLTLEGWIDDDGTTIVVQITNAHVM